jgi:acetyl esterase/lipase
METGRRTYTYKTVGGCKIRADVYAPGDPGPRPVIVWIHGGALIMGGRDELRAWQRDAYLAAGYQVVSIDYRLAPESRLPAIIDDLEDACRWVRQKGPRLFEADPQRMAVIGHSAGGYLTLMAAVRVTPRPQAVVSFYGYGDIVGAWYSRPDPFYLQQPLVSEGEARASVGTRVISETQEHAKRGRFYLYCRQQGIWPREVTGRDPAAEPEWFGQYCPVQQVTGEHPPALLLHGDRDTDVPYEQSVMMATALGHAGVEHEVITIPDGQHGFDAEPTPVARDALRRVLDFLRLHL